jgi:hypothetical protein
VIHNTKITRHPKCMQFILPVVYELKALYTRNTSDPKVCGSFFCPLYALKTLYTQGTEVVKSMQSMKKKGRDNFAEAEESSRDHIEPRRSNGGETRQDKTIMRQGKTRSWQDKIMTRS